MENTHNDLEVTVLFRNCIDDIEHITEVNSAMKAMRHVNSMLEKYTLNDTELNSIAFVHGGIEKIIDALRIPWSGPMSFIHNAVCSLHKLVEGSRERSSYLLVSPTNHFSVLLILIELHQFDDALQLLIFRLFLEIGNNTIAEEQQAFSKQVVASAMYSMESHPDSSKFFYATCCIILKWGPPAPKNLNRMIQNTWYGISNCIDPRSQDIGKQLLRSLFSEFERARRSTMR